MCKLLFFGDARERAVLKKECLAILVLLLVLPVSGCVHKHTAGPIVPAPTQGQISRNDLATRGFSFAGEPRAMCKIGGSEGPCDVEAFVWGETAKNDVARYTCGKLDRATYVGHCVKGKLNGVSLVIADGSKKLAKEAFISYFDQGRIAYPVLTSWLTGDSNFGMEEERKGVGCIYFGKWDKSSERCGLFTEVYGKDIFTESNAQNLREGTFDLDHYRAKFLDFVQRKQ
jgi:hypothetical protein